MLDSSSSSSASASASKSASPSGVPGEYLGVVGSGSDNQTIWFRYPRVEDIRGGRAET